MHNAHDRQPENVTLYIAVFIAFMDFGKTIRMNRNSNLVLGYLFMYVYRGAGERWKVGSHSRVYSGFTGIHVYGSVRFGLVLFYFNFNAITIYSEYASLLCILFMLLLLPLPFAAISMLRMHVYKAHVIIYVWKDMFSSLYKYCI